MNLKAIFQKVNFKKNLLFLTSCLRILIKEQCLKKRGANISIKVDDVRLFMKRELLVASSDSYLYYSIYTFKLLNFIFCF